MTGYDEIDRDEKFTVRCYFREELFTDPESELRWALVDLGLFAVNSHNSLVNEARRAMEEARGGIALTDNGSTGIATLMTESAKNGITSSGRASSAPTVYGLERRCFVLAANYFDELVFTEQLKVFKFQRKLFLGHRGPPTFRHSEAVTADTEVRRHSCATPARFFLSVWGSAYLCAGSASTGHRARFSNGIGPISTYFAAPSVPECCGDWQETCVVIARPVSHRGSSESCGSRSDRVNSPAFEPRLRGQAFRSISAGVSRLAP
jgi:hypothetical protein